jgi:DNA-binding transcriptional regulator YhcF (GntR family)
MTIAHDQSAIVNLAAELDVHPAAAEKALAELQEAAISVATEHGMPDLVRLARRL